MKSIFTTTILCILSILTFAQQGINYQAVARNLNGDEITNTSLSVKFSILEGDSSISSSLSWQEIHLVTTNDFGLFVAKIGKGTSTSLGSSLNFNSIKWGDTTHSLKVEIDYGNGYIDMGTTQFMSVPYALYGEDDDSDPSNEIQTLSISGDTIFISNGNYVIIPGLSFVNNLIVNGCMDSSACNFNPNANTDDGTCLVNYGCTDSSACNYDSLATCEDSSCIASLASPFFENFDNPSSNFKTNGFLNNAGGTPSFNTGPSTDVSGSGNYRYHETSYGYDPTVSLSFTCIDISSLTNPIFSFYYHMYGADMGSLDVKINGSIVWTKSGDQGNSWKLAVIPLIGYSGKIEIEFISKHNGSYLGDKAIDEIRISDDVYGCTDANALNYNSSATIDDGSCIPCIFGCTDSTACNFNPNANCDDGGCLTVYGCTDSTACNYNSNATCDDGSCTGVSGCTDPTACNYNPNATCGDSSCVGLLGCTDSSMYNYNSSATCDDGSCIPIVYGCTDSNAFNYNPLANTLTTPTSLTTTLAGGNGGRGNMFNITNTSNSSINITGFSQGPGFGNNSRSNIEIIVYMMPSAYVVNSSSWNQVGSALTSLTSAAATGYVPVSGVNIPPGATYGFYVGVGPTSNSERLQYTDGVGTPGVTPLVNDNYITVTEGLGGDWPNPAYSPRKWNGKVHYTNGILCQAVVYGCINSIGCNYDPNANTDDGSCILPDGCTDSTACNYDPNATCDDGSCSGLPGCTDTAAFNYNTSATCDDGSCIAKSTVFNYTGSEELFIVPQGVTYLDVEAYGARASTGWSNNFNYGKGGMVSSRISVNQGDSLFINVGGEGSLAGGGSSGGGYNGGGNGRNGGAGGGGATHIAKVSGTLASLESLAVEDLNNDGDYSVKSTNPVLIVAGGGGGGYFYTDSDGGDGGGLIGQNGINNSGYYQTGGSQVKGGQVIGDGTLTGAQLARLGTFGKGGNAYQIYNYMSHGGGGGWFGGAASRYKAHGGSGGSSYTNSSVSSNVFHNQGANSGNGYIIITIQ